ncbi:MAG: P-loop NTPase [Myxococcota bacterium]|nr:P-loop NTPase [Myxococcota bacterium]
MSNEPDDDDLDLNFDDVIEKSQEREIAAIVEKVAVSRLRGQRTAITIGGGSGGIGRSTFAANLGLYLARTGRSVTLVDLDPAGPALHGYLGLSLKVPTPIEQCSGIDVRWERIEGTTLHLCGPSAHFIGYDSRDIRMRILQEASTGPSDYLVIDLGRAYDGISLDVFLDSDVAITMSIPQPMAMEQAYGFLRAAMFRQLVHGTSPASARLRSALSSAKGEAMPTFRTLTELVRKAFPNDWESLSEAIGDFVPGIILNRCDTRADREMLRGMIEGMNRRWAIDAVALGTIDEDDVARQSSKWRRPLVSTYPGAAVTAGIEQVGMAIMTMYRLERGVT